LKIKITKKTQKVCTWAENQAKRVTIQLTQFALAIRPRNSNMGRNLRDSHTSPDWKFRKQHVGQRK